MNEQQKKTIHDLYIEKYIDSIFDRILSRISDKSLSTVQMVDVVHSMILSYYDGYEGGDAQIIGYYPNMDDSALERVMHYADLISARNRRSDGEEPVGKQFEIKLKELGISQKEVAEKWGMTQSNVSRKLKSNDWRESDIRELCDILGIRYKIMLVNN